MTDINETVSLVPPKLEKIISEVRLIPPGVLLPDLSELVKNERMETFEQIHKALHEQLVNLPELETHIWETATYPTIRAAFSGVAPAASRAKLARLLQAEHKRNFGSADKGKYWQASVDSHYRNVISSAFRTYDFVRTAKRNLLVLIRACQQRNDAVRDAFHLMGIVRIDVDERGVVETWTDRFTQAVDGVDATRLRICENCDHIFWAKQERSTCCSDRCHSRIRTQLKRFLESQGFLPGVKLSEKDQAERAALVQKWRIGRRERNPYEGLI